MVTTTLTTHVIAPVQRGEWVEVAATSVRLTRTQGFVHGAATVGERVVAHLDAVFRAPWPAPRRGHPVHGRRGRRGQ